MCHYRYVTTWPSYLPRSLSIPETDLAHNLATSVARYPNQVAVWCEGQALTYRELAQICQQWAILLQNKGVVKGAPVLLALPNSPVWIAVAHACWMLGAVLVPVSPFLRISELNLIVADCGARVGILSQELATIANDAHTGLEYILTDLLTNSSTNIKNVKQSPMNQELHTPCINPSDYCLMAYTSGSTGRPKACLHHHRSAQANIFGSAVWSGFHASSIVLATMPFFHVTGFINSLMAPLAMGGKIIILSRWDAKKAAKLIKYHQITNWSAVSTMVIDLLSFNVDPNDLSSLQRLSGGGAPLPQHIGNRLKTELGLSYLEGYGLSETIAQTHVNPREKPKNQCLGIPYFNVTSHIINPETLEILPDYEIGEIIINGPQLMTGYHNRPEENERVFIFMEGKRFLRTGDLGYRDSEGYYFFVDRIKRLINVSGLKVSPAEVESLLMSHPSIKEACVIAVPHSRTGESVHAIIVPYQSVDIDICLLYNWCRERISSYKIPIHFVIQESLPKTASGKINWRKVQDDFS